MRYLPLLWHLKEVQRLQGAIDPSYISKAGKKTPHPSDAPGISTAPVTRNEIEELFDRKLSTLKVYVLESEITEAQQAVKSIVELSSF